MRRLHMVAAAFVMSAVAGYAVAQQFPNLFLTSPTGAEIVDVAGIGPQHESVYLKQVRDARGYQKATPATGFTLSFKAGQSEMAIVNPATDATGTVNLSPTPVDGQMNCFYTKSVVTALTLAAPASATINDGITATTATTNYCYLYSASNTTWDRVE